MNSCGRVYMVTMAVYLAWYLYIPHGDILYADHVSFDLSNPASQESELFLCLSLWASFSTTSLLAILLLLSPS